MNKTKMLGLQNKETRSPESPKVGLYSATPCRQVLIFRLVVLMAVVLAYEGSLRSGGTVSLGIPARAHAALKHTNKITLDGKHALI